MSRPYSVQLTLFDPEGERNITRIWAVPAGVEITTARLAPLGAFLLAAIAELDAAMGQADGGDL